LPPGCRCAILRLVKRSPLIPTLLATVTALLLSAVAGEFLAGSKPKTQSYEFEPDTDEQASLLLEGNTWRARSDLYRVELQMLDNAGRMAFMKHQTGTEIDPFAARPDQPPSFYTFLLVVENRGEQTLMLHPQNCWLVAGKGRSEYPLDVDTIRSAYHTLQAELPASYEVVGQVLFQRERIIKPGETHMGLLVYRSPSPRLRRFVVEIPLTLPSGDVTTLKAPYRRLKEDKKG
jgi:hypothetical protein